MALARVGAHTGTNITFSSTVTTGSWASTQGSLLVAFAEADTVALNGITVSDNTGNQWIRAFSQVNGGAFDMEVWYATNALPSATHTVTAVDNGGGVDSLIIVEEWTGQTYNPFDIQSESAGTGTAITTGAGAPNAVAAEVVFGFCAQTGTPTITLGTGYTNLTQINSAFTTIATESKVTSTTGSQVAAFTSTLTNAWSIIMPMFTQVTAAAKPYEFMSFSN